MEGKSGTIHQIDVLVEYKHPRYRNDNSKFEYFKKKTGKNEMLISAERNDRWDVSSGVAMGELDTWLSIEEINKIQNHKELEL